MKTYRALCILIYTSIGFLLGWCLCPQFIEPEVVPVGYYTVVLVDRPVPEPYAVPVERVIVKTEYVRIPQPLRNFETVNELKDFLSRTNVDETTIIMNDPKEKADCDDYALLLIKYAHREGYALHFQIDKIGHRGHALCCALIGNEVYFIEPSTDEYWKVANID